MSHIVVYQTDDGSSGFEQCNSLDDAIVVAERMRNVDGVEAPRIFRMEEVHIDFRPYYRVEVAETDSGESGSDPGRSDAGSQADATAVDTTLDDLPAPPSPEAVAEAEAETGAQMSSDSPSWAADDADVSEPADATESAAESTGDDAETTDSAEDADAGEAEGSGDDDSADEESGDDAMISVRRGLFGR